MNQLATFAQKAGQAGDQTSQAWKAGEGGRGIVFTARPDDAEHAYALTFTGENALLHIVTGTSDEHVLSDIQLPARFVCYGAVRVSARQDDNALPATVRVMAGYASGPSVPDVAAVRNGPVSIEPSAVALRALVACTLTVRGVAVALAAGQAIELRQPAVLLTGTATIQYEP